MILVASQRGGAKQLGVHLLRTDENEHVDVHEVRGFVSEDVVGAFKEVQAISAGTKCKQFLFSVSLNPPDTERVDTPTFENAMARIEKAHGLEGQPRVVVFHEKEGRRHCHAVWSRIDAVTMTAKPLPYFKNKMRETARELYIDHGWKMPRGLMNYGQADPRNYTLAEWQQAKRLKLNPADIKQLFQECWAVSDGLASFKAAIEERGFYLAQGNRRSFVAVSHEGEVISVSRNVGRKPKQVAERLGDSEDLPSVEEAKARIATELTPIVQNHLAALRQRHQQEARPFIAATRRMQEHHKAQRTKLIAHQNERQSVDDTTRKARLRRGMLGLWDRLSGRRAKTLAHNAAEYEAALRRDHQEREQLRMAQLIDRQVLQTKIKAVRQNQTTERLDIRSDVARLAKMSHATDGPLSEQFNQTQPAQADKPSGPRKPNTGPDFEI